MVLTDHTLPHEVSEHTDHLQGGIGAGSKVCEGIDDCADRLFGG